MSIFDSDADDDPFFDGDASEENDDMGDDDGFDDGNDDEYENYLRESERRNEEYTCQYGDRCLCPHFMHHRSECFTVEMAEQFAQEDARAQQQEGRR